MHTSSPANDATTTIEYPAAKRYLCRCLRVTEQDVREACAAGAIHEVRDAMQKTGAGTGCMACRCSLRTLIEDCRRQREAAAALDAPPQPVFVALT